MAVSFEEARSKIRRRVSSVDICMDGELSDRLAHLTSQLVSARANADDTLGADEVCAKLEQEIAAVKGDAEAATVSFRFRALGQQRWEDLIAEHAPSKKQRDDAAKQRQRLPWNPDVFPYIAIAESCEEPRMTADEVRELFGEFNFSQWRQLWEDGCLGANLGDASVPKAGGFSASLSRSERRSEPLPDSESPVPSSSDE